MFVPGVVSRGSVVGSVFGGAVRSLLGVFLLVLMAVGSVVRSLGGKGAAPSVPFVKASSGVDPFCGWALFFWGEICCGFCLCVRALSGLPITIVLNLSFYRDL